MPAYDYLCTYCDNVVEVRHGMNEHPAVACDNCASRMVKTITEFPHVAFAWKAHDSADTGSDRLTLHRAKRGRSTPIDEFAGKRV